MTKFSEYIEHGWALVPIKPGQKGPRTRAWNQRANVITDPAHDMASAGLAHAYSGTCAIDIDNFDVAARWLDERGVDLVSLFNAPDSVQLCSGRANHGKLLYALAEPMAGKTVATYPDPNDPTGKKKLAALDFRCATSGGLTVQDVLPPSLHPETGEPYFWRYGDSLLGDWRDLPVLPQALHDIWLSELEHVADRDHIPAKGADVGELRRLLELQDPDTNRNDWIKVGMAIHHETDGSLEGFELWDEWSSKGEKYLGRRDLEAPWRSFHDTPNAVTIGALRRAAVADPSEFDVVDLDEISEDDPWVRAEAQRVARFRLTPVGDIARRDPPDWLVEDLLPDADLAMIYGPPGAGKSFVGLDLAFSVAHGLPFFNRKTEAGPVVWIAAEAAGEMRNRANAYAQARGVELDATDLFVVEQTISLMNQDDARALTQAVQGATPRLIIIDTLAAASGGANENSGEDMNEVLSRCREMHEATGALVVLIHHSGKDSSRGARGWSGLKAAVHTEIELTADPASPVRMMEVKKQRSGPAGVELPFKLDVVNLVFGDNVTSCVVEPLDPIVLEAKADHRIGGNQRTTMKVVWDLAAVSPEGEVPIQDVYDDVIARLPTPAVGVRDQRKRKVMRALEGLAERGFISFRNEGATVVVGDEINDYE